MIESIPILFRATFRNPVVVGKIERANTTDVATIGAIHGRKNTIRKKLLTLFDLNHEIICATTSAMPIFKVTVMSTNNSVFKSALRKSAS